GATPYVYLLKQTEAGTYAKYLELACNSQASLDNSLFLMQDAGNGWVRYFLVVATGDSSLTLKLALFNGKIDAGLNADEQMEGTSAGTVYFDQALQSSIGTYVRDNTAEEMFTKDENGEWQLDETLAAEMTYTATAGYQDWDDIAAEVAEKDNIAIADERTTDITEPVEESEEIEDDTEEQTSNTDWALVVSICTSALLVAALLIVIVVKYFFKTKKN
ncbi:MAG: hypothetical protein J6Q55_00775, partial [Clostridia bacterium]|nr:hypothetical protein [Clostridia bacterium]